MSSFYDSNEWKRVRYQAIIQYGRTCMCCGTTSGEIHVDHIKPVSLYPELRLDITNLQILCRDCNLGKSNIDLTDFREKKLEVIKCPPALWGYITISGKTFHIWDGSDTRCRMWSTGGLKMGDKFRFSKNKMEGIPMCTMCRTAARESFKRKSKGFSKN